MRGRRSMGVIHARSGHRRRIHRGAADDAARVGCAERRRLRGADLSEARRLKGICAAFREVQGLPPRAARPCITLGLEEVAAAARVQLRAGAGRLRGVAYVEQVRLAVSLPRPPLLRPQSPRAGCSVGMVKKRRRAGAQPLQRGSERLLGPRKGNHDAPRRRGRPVRRRCSGAAGSRGVRRGGWGFGGRGEWG